MKKKLLMFTLGLIIVIFSSIPFTNLFAASSLTVDCNNVLRGATHCASGSLYGVTESVPADVNNLIAPLNPYVFTQPARAGSGYQQPYGAAIPVAQRLKNTTGKVMIRLADVFPGWPYQFTNMSDWHNKISSVINDKRSSGLNNFYGYEIWNEPGGTWNTANGSFNEMWRQTYNLIRSLDPNEPIIGPSYSYYKSNDLRNFLTYCISNNCVPDIICWHELSSHDSNANTDYIASHIKDYRNMESSLGLSQRRISLNEYCDTEHAKEGCPGPSASMIAKFERYKIDSACITWWFTAYPGRLGSLLATNSQKGAGWWFYEWYGQMSGNMVYVTPPNESSAMVDGLACVDSNAQYVSCLFGGNNEGTVNVTFKNLPSFIGSTANVKVESVHWVSKDTVVNGTNKISESTYNVSNGSITVSVSGCNNNDGYRIYITGSGTTTPTPTPGVTSAFTQIEAEKFNNQSGIQTETCSEGGENVGYIENGDYISFSNIDFGNGAGSFEARVASGTSGGNIEIMLDSTNGTLIGTCTVSGTGDWQSWTTVTTNVSNVSGNHDLYLLFTGGSDYLMNINWFRFNTSSTVTPTGTCGDVNSSGNVDITDALLISQYYVGGNPANFDQGVADVNGDRNVNIQDALLVAQYYVGIIDTLSCN